MSNFDSDPLTLDPALYPVKNSPNKVKDNHIFQWKKKVDRALILIYLDSSTAGSFSVKECNFSISANFGGKQGS